MALSEFAIINRYFNNQQNQRQDVILGIGDDCALLKVPPQQELAVSMDTLVADVHFPATTTAYDIGYKSLAVNLSDLAAMGATPAWVTLSLTMPTVDEQWLDDFTKGFSVLLQQHHLQLIGGDLSRGPLAITIQVHGFVPSGMALRRDGAKPGDKIYVTGHLGGAALALQSILGAVKLSTNDRDYVLKSFNQPTPRIAEGLQLRGIASAAIDISDGLAADLSHILQQSNVGATIKLANLAIEPRLLNYLPSNEAYILALTGGDDYELCFTIPPANEQHLAKIQQQLKTKFSYLGVIEKLPSLRIIDDKDQLVDLKTIGYQHF